MRQATSTTIDPSKKKKNSKHNNDTLMSDSPKQQSSPLCPMGTMSTREKKGNMLWLGKSNVMGVPPIQLASRVAFIRGKGAVFDRNIDYLVSSRLLPSWLKDMASCVRKELLAILIFLMATPLRAFVGWWSVKNPVKQHVRFL